MSEQSGRRSARNFAFQSTDHLGPSTPASYIADHLSTNRYNAASNTGSTSSSAIHGPAQEAHRRYSDYHIAQDSRLDPLPGAQFPNYAVGSGGPMVWDWNNSADFPDFMSHYEPQGELAEEPQNSHFDTQNFTIPLPVVGHENFQPPSQAVRSAPATAIQNPLSPPPKPPSKPALQIGMKRKTAESESNSAVSQGPGFNSDLQPPAAKRFTKSRSSSLASTPSPAVATAKDALPVSSTTMAQISTAVTASEAPTISNNVTSTSGGEVQQRKEPSKGTGPAGRVIDVSKPRKIVESPGGADVLPAGKVFPIQIGSELSRLSGASLSSDAPSYFTHFFSEQIRNSAGRAGDLKTLYIDRDPATFKDIALHLQGYHVMPQDAQHFVRLFADAQFYSLPRLTKQLFNTDIFIKIGQRDFQIPRDLFSSPGDSPNYFSLGFAHFFSTPNEVFPGLDRNSLLRPPSIRPPVVVGRSGDTFAELIKIAQGYDIHIRDEEHRAELLRDARYFHFKGLEQRLIPCDISYNLKRAQTEIVIRLEDIRQSGISFTPDPVISSAISSGGSVSRPIRALSPAAGTSATAREPVSPANSVQAHQFARAGTICYARPYTDDHAQTNVLVLEIAGQECATLHVPSQHPPRSGSPLTLDLRAMFHGHTLSRITSLFSVIASKMGLPATQPLGLMMMASGGGVAKQPVSPANSGVSERRVRVRWDEDACVIVDGREVTLGVGASGRVGVRWDDEDAERSRKRRKVDDTRDADEGTLNDAGIDIYSQDQAEWIWPPSTESPSLSLPHLDIPDYNPTETIWIIKRAHFRIRVEPVVSTEVESLSATASGAPPGKMQVVLCVVRLEVIRNERVRNRGRGFLTL